MAMYELCQDRLQSIEKTTFAEASLREREDLQRLIRDEPDAIAEGTLIVAEEFGDFEESRRRIDLLGVDGSANLVVIELKRDERGGHMELQAVRYAAMVSTMTFAKTVSVYAGYLKQRNRAEVDAESSLLEHLGWDEPKEDEFGQRVRVVLASGDFGRELTTAVLWLNDQGLDITCMRLRPYRLRESLLLDVTQVIPLPEAADYQEQVREKTARERTDRGERHGLRRRFWGGLLHVARQRTDLHANISAGEYSWIGSPVGLPRGFGLNYVIQQHSGRMEIYIDRKDAALSEQAFDTLVAERESIEAAFGPDLHWDRMDGRQACRISYTSEIGGYRDDPADWPAVFETMVDAMIRLEAAFRPYWHRVPG